MANRYFDNSQLAEAIRIASGDTKGVSHINKFGYNPSIADAVETIWDGGGTYSYLDSVGLSSVLTVTSSVADSGLNLEIQGLDASYQSLTETITATSAGNTGTSEFYRVFRAIVSGNSDSSNVNDITVEAGSTTLAQVSAGKGQTLMALYTIPAGKTAYLKQFQGSMDKSNASAIFKMMARPSDGVFNIKGQFGSAGGSPVTYDYSIPLKFDEKTDLEVKAETSGTSGAGAVFDLILLDN